MFDPVPVLPVVLPLGAAVLGGLLWLLHRRGRLSWPRIVVALALAVYVAGVVANTVFPIYRDKPTAGGPWADHLALVPLVDYEVADAVMNVLVFVPVGVLVPLVIAGTSWGSAVVAAGALSLTIEVTQWATAHLLGGGHIADVNDLIFNVIGGVVGVALIASAEHVPAIGRVVDQVRWRGARADGSDVLVGQHPAPGS
ncbi:MAG: VanZ family protein [Cellulomonadaceae bacterium]|nr:VanZ family protein [Cellulomonadaceae bacterium]